MTKLMKNTSKKISLLEMIGGEMITEKNILSVIYACINTLKDMGYNIGSDIYFLWGDSPRVFGEMQFPKYEGGYFSLVLNKHMLNDSEDSLKSIIYHELAHYICYKEQFDDGVLYWIDDKVYHKKDYDKVEESTHGKRWKRIANNISGKTGVKISITDSFDSHKDMEKYAEEKYKYIIRCKNCGQEYKYAKQTTFVKDPNVKLANGEYRYYCTKCKAAGQFEKVVNEALEVSDINPYTCGYIKDDGTLLQLDEYHGEEPELRDLGYVEYSDTHIEDVCVRIYKEPTKEQYKQLEKIIDLYLDQHSYCKIEIWKDGCKYNYYKVFSLYEGACDDLSIDEKVGDWTGYKLIQIIKNYFNKQPLTEELLLELNRSQLISKSKRSDNYKDQSKGCNRWERRNKSRIDTKVAQYNKIDMNDLFKNDELKVGINVHGETSDYVVLIRYNYILEEIQNQIKRNNNKLEFKCILIALQRVFNQGNVFVSCTCKDWQYRQAYNASKGGYNSGNLEIRASNITNPGDTKGAGCKHVNLVLGNVDWIMKVASVINNYIHYMETNYQRKYADLIFPKIFGIPYQKAVQMNLFDKDDNLDDSENEIALSNKYGRERTRFNRDIQINNQRNFKFNKDDNKVQTDLRNQPRLDLNMTRKTDEIKQDLQNKNDDK